jgi:hypothetical protein
MVSIELQRLRSGRVLVEGSDDTSSLSTNASCLVCLWVFRAPYTPRILSVHTQTDSVCKLTYPDVLPASLLFSFTSIRRAGGAQNRPR